MNPPRPAPAISPIPDRGDIQKALSGLILSASGWRKVFAEDGDEESNLESMSVVDQLVVAAMAVTYGRTVSNGAVIAVATDSRPTGPLMADIIIRVLLNLGLRVRYSGVTAIPELLSAVQVDSAVTGFAYVSASHNPIGHNGLKFGYSDGSVAGGEKAARLISSFRRIMEKEDPAAIAGSVSGADAAALRDVYEGMKQWKERTFSCYYGFTRDLSAGEGGSGEDLFHALRVSARRFPLGVVAELNGSARSTTIDGRILTDLGVKVHALNDTPGRIAHRIVPEGSSLDLCRETLETMHGIDPAFFVGYVPDNDGDRGNLVYMGRDKTARALHAQEVFALSCLGELAYLSHRRREAGRSDLLGDTVVVANGPTSMRIDRITGAFGAGTERAEVGEANVVGLARELRASGRIVRFLGEGSNGGNITHPAACRDPLNTLLSILKLMLVRSGPGGPGLFELWCTKSGQDGIYRQDYTLEDIIASLPSYTTTSAYEDRAIMHISSTDHGRLKAEYERLFVESWPEMEAFLRREIDVAGWQFINYEGTKTAAGAGNRAADGPQSGGLKVLLENPDGVPVAYLWMRGSGTEPVFRILVDVEGDRPGAEAQLLSWQRGLIERADRIVAEK